MSDFLSRQNNDNSNPHEIEPISFNMYQVLCEKYYNTENTEKQHANPIKGSVEKPYIAQDRTGLRRRRPAPINQTIISSSELSQKFPGETKIGAGKTNCVNSTDPMHSVNNMDEGMTHARPLILDIPFYPGATYRPPSKLIRSNMPRSQES